MVSMITSLQNDKVKLVYGLQNRARTRRKERRIVLEGTRLVRDAVEQGKRPAFVLYDAQTVDYELLALLQQGDSPLLEVSDEVMRHLTDTQQPQGILGIFPLPRPQLPKRQHRILILDNVRDPGNMGTILRTAAASGVDMLLLSPGCADPYNPKALRSGMGAHFRVPVIEPQWHEIEGYCENLAVYAAAANGETRYDEADWRQPHALIVGSEAHGIGRRSSELARSTVYIPMAAETESINVAMAAGIILFEAARQNLTDGA